MAAETTVHCVVFSECSIISQTISVCSFTAESTCLLSVNNGVVTKILLARKYGTSRDIGLDLLDLVEEFDRKIYQS